MPDIDGGHAFLTVLFPLHTEPCIGDVGVTSPAHAVREILGTLPTAQHSPASAGSHLQSPFAGSFRTHFARFAVMDAPAFNGRDTADALRTALSSLTSRVDLLEAQPVDRFERPYLLFCADFDVAENDNDPIGSYLTELWGCMGADWARILSHCEGYRHGDQRDFVEYLRSCRVETTMPFNDYAVAPPPPRTPPVTVIAATALGVLVVVGGLIGLLAPFPWWGRAGLGLAAGLAAALLAAFVLVFRMGPRPAPYAPGVDLRTILKALYVQAAFSRFAATRQGCDPATLLSSFQAFLTQTDPTNLQAPTQAPGVVPLPEPAP